MVRPKDTKRGLGVSHRLLYIGGMLVVSIPAKYARQLEWKPGDEVRVELVGKEIRVWKARIVRP